MVDECHAGTIFTQPQSNATVPPKLGSKTSKPFSASSSAISTIASIGAPVRLAIASTVSP